MDKQTKLTLTIAAVVILGYLAWNLTDCLASGECHFEGRRFVRHQVEN